MQEQKVFSFPARLCISLFRFRWIKPYFISNIVSAKITTTAAATTTAIVIIIRRTYNLHESYYRERRVVVIKHSLRSAAILLLFVSDIPANANFIFFLIFIAITV